MTDAYNAIRSGMEERSITPSLKEEIAVSPSRNRQLGAQVAQMSELQKENDRLLGLLNVTETTPETDYIAATVVAKEAGGWFSTFTVDKGERDGVKKDDPVLNDSGLIGRVMSVTDSPQRSSPSSTRARPSRAWWSARATTASATARSTSMITTKCCA